MQQVRPKTQHAHAVEEHVRFVRQVLAHQDAREAIVLSERASERMLKIATREGT